ncbi:MAG: hypothetical protein AAB557_03290 [Patescibacteria group bacterium]
MRAITGFITKSIGFIKKNKLFFLIPVFVLIMGDVILFPISSDIRIFGILLFFFYLIKRFALTSTVTLLFSLLLLILTYVMYLWTDPLLFYQPLVPAVERFAVWLYLFLVLGIYQKWRE